MISLKLAQFDILKEQKGYKPIVLLDDIFDKLDDDRISMLVSMIKNKDFGQVFITDARPERTTHFLGDIAGDLKIITISDGAVVE